MENYIKKFNHEIITKNDEKKQRKVKNVYLSVGSIVLSIGALGFLASFVTFMILFFDFRTDEAMMAWVIAIPFILMIVAGSVVTRVGDMLLKDFVEQEYQQDQKKKKATKQKDEIIIEEKQHVEKITLKKEKNKTEK